MRIKAVVDRMDKIYRIYRISYESWKS